MRRYTLPVMRQLRKQLLYAAETVRQRHVQRLERLYASVKADREYTYEYVFYRATGFRPETNGRPALPGERLRGDLRTLLADLCETVTFEAASAKGPVYTIDDLTARFSVSTKTISRWRRRGLLSRRYVFPRARELLAEKTEYMDNEVFGDPDAEQMILAQPLDELRPHHKRGRAPKVPRDLPPYLQGLYRLPLLTKEQEVALFRRYNYLKYRIARAKEGLDPTTVTASELRRVNDLKEQALQVKNILIQSNLRLVVSIAKRHVGRMMNFFELVSDGNVSLMRAVEKFDFAKGNKFSTYASWAIIKNFARTIPEENYRLDRYVTGREEMLDTAGDRRRKAEEEVDSGASVRELVGKVLEQLSERERRVIVRRFGLGEAARPLKLEDVGREMGVTKERIRQIEARALNKLRGMVDPETLGLSAG